MTVKEAVKYIISESKKDESLLTDTKRFWAYLIDLSSDYRKELNVIKRSLDSEFLELCFKSEDDLRRRVFRMKYHLENQGIAENWIDFIIDSFFSPLGWKPVEDEEESSQPQQTQNQQTQKQQAQKQQTQKQQTQKQQKQRVTNYIEVTLDHTVLSQLGYNVKRNTFGNIIRQNGNYVKDLVIPSTYRYDGKNYKITEIVGYYVFSGCSSLTSIRIPDSVTKIGEGAFSGCSSLTNIAIPNSVKEIGDSAFLGCSSLSNITIPDSVTKIGDSLFSDCSSLANVIISNSITEIGNWAFGGGSSLTNIRIPDSVTEIGYDAFFRIQCIYYNGFASGRPWGALKIFSTHDIEVILDEKIFNKLGYRILRSCLKNYIYINNQQITSLFIPLDFIYNGKYYKITKIGDFVFSGCTSLTSVTISDNVTQIGEGAFEGCTYLTNVTIPNSVKKIGARAFRNCIYLDIVIPDSVIEIDEHAFAGVLHIEYHGKAKYNDSWLFGDKYWGAKSMN